MRLKMYKNIWCLSLGLLAQHSVQAVQDTLMDSLVKASNGLNALIAKAQAENMNPPLSLQQQTQYVVWFKQFKQDVSDLKNQGDDVTQLEQVYVPRYHDWAYGYEESEGLITDNKLLTELSKPVAVEQKPEETLSPEEQAFDKLRVAKMKTIYSNVQDHALAAEKAFTVQVKAQIKSLGSYSKKNAQAFTEYLAQSRRSFEGSMRTAKVSAYADYYSFLEKSGKQSDDPRDVTPDEKYLFDGVETIIQEAILQVRALILDMTSAAIKADMGLQVAEALKESEAQAKKEYDAQLTQNVQALDRSWWDDVKAVGKTLLGDFADRFPEELKKEVMKQGKDAAVKFGGEVIEGAKKKVIEPVSEQVSGLSEKLESQTLTQLYNDHADPALKALKRVIRMVNPVIDKPLPTETVQVQSGVGLSSDEKEYLANRMPKVQKALKANFDIDQPLRLAFCCSGGGNRAMIGTLGMLIAAANAKFLDASVYMAGLSGSTWTIVPWSYLYLKNSFKSKDFATTLTSMRDSFAPALQGAGMLKPPFLKSDVTRAFSKIMTSRFAYNQHLSAVDILGSLVGNYALNLAGSNRLNATWSSLTVAAKAGRIPLPLGSAAFNPGMKTDSKTDVGSLYEWFETSPFQAGSTVLGYIPIRWFGSEFKDGKIVSEFITPEYPISFYLGVYGSAFGLSLHDVVEKGLPDTSFNVGGVKVDVPVDLWVKEIIQENFGKDAGAARSGKIHARFPNYSVGVLKSILQNETDLGLFDGGIAFNFPLPLLLDRPERAVDVIIIYDSNPGDVPVFKTAEKYFKRKGIAIPDLSAVTTGDSKKAKALLLEPVMTVFNDPRTASYNPKVVTFIYFPTRPPIDISKAPFTTANFGYSEQDVSTLAGDMEKAFESQVPVMKTILKMVAQQRHGTTEDTKKPIVKK